MKVGGLEQWRPGSALPKPAEIYAKGEARRHELSDSHAPRVEAIGFRRGCAPLTRFRPSHGQEQQFASAPPMIALMLSPDMSSPASAPQQIYQAYPIALCRPACLDALHHDLQQLDMDPQHGQLTALPLSQAITLKQVSYRYPGAPQPALKGVDLNILAHSTVGLVGTTGSGHTTTVDLILGLLEPQTGYLSVDGERITAANRRQWQCAIGYVPQHIYLFDDSVAANIAFGVNPTDIDPQAVERAAKTANLHEFVINDLPDGYATIVGERGVRLSGGQRQRIGIARALYHNPEVLILDEATSALDNLTEQAVMEAVNNLGHDITTILIAHRLSTVRHCDQIYLLERGEVKAQGTFEELTQASERFREMAASH